MATNGSTLAPTQLAAIVSHLSSQGHVAAAYLLGSAADRRLRPDSDVDIAVLPIAPNRLLLIERLTLAVESGSKDWIRLGETLGVMIRP